MGGHGQRHSRQRLRQPDHGLMSRRQRNLLGPQGMGGLVGLWGASSLIESIQYGTVSLGAGTTATATITAVDVSRSVLIDLRSLNNWSAGTQPAYTSTRLTLTNSTTVTGDRNASGGITCSAGFAIVQFRPGVIKSVQYGNINGGAATNTATITSVNTDKTFLLSLGIIGDTGGLDGYFYSILSLTNATTVTATRGIAGGAGVNHGFVAVEGF